MTVMSEFFIDFCFIRPKAAAAEPSMDLQRQVEKWLRSLLGECAVWALSCREQEGLEIVTAETKGIAPWRDEDEALARFEADGDPEFWRLLYGYRMRVIPKTDAGSCKWKPYGSRTPSQSLTKEG
jgi:hypothetical protein